MDLAGKTVLLTGASRGIGRALAAQLVAKGATVLAVARSADGMGREVVPLACDLSDRADRDLLLAKVGAVDGVINNAAIQVEADFLRGAAAADIAREIAVNLEAPLHLCAALAPGLATRGGFVVNVTSALALAPKASAPVYCATKAGQASFTRALRYQAEREGGGLLVCDCVMALVDTGMTAGRGRGKLTPDQAAAALLHGLERRQPEIWIGKTRALRAIHRLSPGLAARILRNG